MKRTEQSKTKRFFGAAMLATMLVLACCVTVVFAATDGLEGGYTKFYQDISPTLKLMCTDDFDCGNQGHHMELLYNQILTDEKYAGTFHVTYDGNGNSTLTISNTDVYLETINAELSRPHSVTDFPTTLTTYHPCTVYDKCVDHLYEVTKLPTCEETGTGHLQCRECGKKFADHDVTIQPQGHRDVTKVLLAPTCTEGGYKIHWCDHAYCDDKNVDPHDIQELTWIEYEGKQYVAYTDANKKLFAGSAEYPLLEKLSPLGHTSKGGIGHQHRKPAEPPTPEEVMKGYHHVSGNSGPVASDPYALVCERCGVVYETPAGWGWDEGKDICLRCAPWWWSGNWGTDRPEAQGDTVAIGTKLTEDNEDTILHESMTWEHYDEERQLWFATKAYKEYYDWFYSNPDFAGSVLADGPYPSYKDEENTPEPEPDVPDEAQQPDATDKSQQSDATDESQQSDATDKSQQPNVTDESQQSDATDESQQSDATDKSQQPDATDKSQQPDATVESQQPNATDESQQPSATDESQQPSATDESQQPSATDNMNVISVEKTAAPKFAAAGNGLETYEYVVVQIGGMATSFRNIDGVWLKAGMVDNNWVKWAIPANETELRAIASRPVLQMVEAPYDMSFYYGQDQGDNGTYQRENDKDWKFVDTDKIKDGVMIMEVQSRVYTTVWYDAKTGEPIISRGIGKELIPLEEGQNPMIDVWVEVTEDDKLPFTADGKEYTFVESDPRNFLGDWVHAGLAEDPSSEKTTVLKLFFVAKDEEPNIPDDAEYTLTVLYLDAADKVSQVAKPYTAKLKKDATYNVTSPEVADYGKADRETVSGTMPAGNVIEKVYYTKTTTPPPPDNPNPVTPVTYPVRYQWTGLPEGAGEKLPATQRYASGISVKVDTVYTQGKEAVVDGKTYVFSGWDTEDFRMPAKDVVISGTWAEKSEEHTQPVKHTLTVNYVYAEDGSEAAPTVHEALAKDAQFNVASPVIEGYTPDQAVVAGTMGDEDIVVTVVYTAEEPVDVPDEDTPLVEEPDVDKTPDADVPPEETEIPDEDTPLTDVPQTGDLSMGWYAALMLSICGLVLLNLKRRKILEG